MQFQHQTAFYSGKVRDVYTIKNQLLVMVASNRISAFDVILPREIPFKGQVLNQIAAEFLRACQDILPIWLLDTPFPNIAVGRRCEPFEVEMVIRGNLAGHAWRTYKSGQRQLCGVSLPEGLKENDYFPTPIITPTTKATHGHDEDISREDIIAKNIVSEADYIQLENYTQALFERGKAIAAERGLILVDTKYEFGKIGDTIYLMDEIHTPDSSRYFYADAFQYNQDNNLPQKQLSKEFVREWLMENGFQGKEGQVVPEMNDAVVENISNRYIELYEKIMGKPFTKADYTNDHEIESVINQWTAQQPA